MKLTLLAIVISLILAAATISHTPQTPEDWADSIPPYEDGSDISGDVADTDGTQSGENGESDGTDESGKKGETGENTDEKAAAAEPFDFNHNGKSDAEDILAGAKADAANHPTYNSAYYVGGYPPDNIGVCTDVVWRALKCAGYCLRDMVDCDIKAHTCDYPAAPVPDKNIDFRRVRNLHVFFEKYAQSCTCDVYDCSQWQPGDIVIFGKDKHVGIVSDIKNAQGIPYIIHNSGQKNREEDYLTRSTTVVTAHYRFDASLLPEDLLIAW